MRIIMLGTGHAVVTECYNTCFVIQDEAGHGLLVDGGGGSGIVTQMRHAHLVWEGIHEVFVTHRHIDHLLGIVWLLRMVGMGMRRGSYEGVLRIYGNEETLNALEHVAYELLRDAEQALLGNRIRLVRVADGETFELLGCPTRFFDLHAHDVSQLGFSMEYEPGSRLVCCGDVALKEADYANARGARWLMHEAFCLSDHPASTFIRNVGHSTVAEACATAERLGVEHVVLYHTEDHDLVHRRERYVEEGRRFFSGSIHVPDDLETIEL